MFERFIDWLLFFPSAQYSLELLQFNSTEGKNILSILEGNPVPAVLAFCWIFLGLFLNVREIY
jgi:hypothetical protein